MNFSDTILQAPSILTEGAVVERIRRDPRVHLDPNILHAGFVYSPLGRGVLGAIYREYFSIGWVHRLPLLAFSPTWRANRDRLIAAGFRESDDVNGDCCRFVSGIRDEFGEYGKLIYLGGLVGCRGDAYKPAESLSAVEATSFHRFQVQALSHAGVDFLIGATLPAAPEAIGLARAMAESTVPYVLSFVIRPEGTLLDGTPLHAIIDEIDSAVRPPPFFYMVNCTHPSVFSQAMTNQKDRLPEVSRRIVGLEANSSSKSPEELDNLVYLVGDEPDLFADAMVQVRKQFGLRILGGCCGTDARHLESIARQL